MLWIRNDLFRIQLQIFGVPDPGPVSDPTHITGSSAYLEIILKNTLNSIKKKNIGTGTGTNYLTFSFSNYGPTVHIVQN